MRFEDRERVYGCDEYYWGREPNDFARRTAEKAVNYHGSGDPWNSACYRLNDYESPRVVDIGAGEGRDAAFCAERGFDVVATDVSSTGLGKSRRLAEDRMVDAKTREVDANDIVLEQTVDVVYTDSRRIPAALAAG